MNAAGIISEILVFVIYVWLLILAAWASSSASGSLKKYIMATYVVGTIATIVVMILIAYA